MDGWLAVEVFKWLLRHPAIGVDAQARALLSRAYKTGAAASRMSFLKYNARTRPIRGSIKSPWMPCRRAIGDMFDEMNKASSAVLALAARAAQAPEHRCDRHCSVLWTTVADEVKVSCHTPGYAAVSGRFSWDKFGTI